MLVVLLRFSENKGKAGQFMEGHKEWIKRGFDDGVFLLVGSLQPNSGGGILAHDTSLADLQSSPSKADARLDFLLKGRR
jgi:uncharacterized protein YciI